MCRQIALARHSQSWKQAGQVQPQIPQMMNAITGAGRRVIRTSIFLLALSSAAMTTIAEAQYFGRNKVQYESFDFRIYRSQHFDVHFYSEFAAPAADATRMLERWYGRLSVALDHTFDRNPIVLYANHPDFQQTNVIGGELSQGTGGVTESNRTRVVLPLTGVYADNDHVLGHELVHVFQYDIAGSKEGGGLPNMSRIPLWAVEGLAEYLSIGRQDAHTAMWLRDAILRKDIPTIRDLAGNPKYFPYRYGQGVWAYIGGRWNDARVADLYRAAAATGELEGSIIEILGMSSDSLSAQWHRAIREHYEPLMIGRTPPDSAGKPLIVEKEGGLNISPVISPDGRYVAFFSQRGLFSVDLYVADAQTGKILKTLASPTRGGHFDDLSFISSAGAWSPDSKKFAFIVFADGDNEIHVLDVASRDVDARIKTAGVGAVTGVTWSPDGARIAFAGVAGGVSDLFVVDATGSNLVRLTNDKWAALHPSWSPDGRTIAFATDQGQGANLDILATSSMQIALFDIAARRVTVLPGLGEAKSINPQFSPDGQSIFFISDLDGFSDIFRMDLAGGASRRVTHLKTGVSGITYLSPALSVSQATGRLVFSVFSGSGTGIYSLEANEATGTPIVAGSPGGGTLPPVQRGAVEGYLADNTTYLPAETTFPVRDYSARLGLDYIGQPTIGFTSSEYGSGFFGSVSAYFGDMLGNRSLGIAVTGQGDVRDYGAQAFFQNTTHRLNWAIVGGRVPYLSGFTSVSGATVNVGGVDQPARITDQTIRRSYYDQAGIQFQYPFSSTRRVEFDAGFTHLSYNTETFRWVEFAGGASGPERISQPSPSPITYGTASAALVGDNSFFGYTSPIAGGRYRLEGSPIFGGLNFMSLFADGRKYLLARPVTFAFRGMHYGRYGGDAEDDRLTPLYVGNDQFVRGYSIYSFTSADCGGSSTGCPQFDRLIGSRIAVANAEIRVPLFGARGFSLIPSSFLPIELAAFADAGMAWTESEKVHIRFDRATTDRVPVFSAGLSSRINLFGFAIAEIFYAKPFQRTSRSGIWGVQLVPGW